MLADLINSLCDLLLELAHQELAQELAQELEAPTDALFGSYALLWLGTHDVASGAFAMPTKYSRSWSPLTTVRSSTQPCRTTCRSRGALYQSVETATGARGS